MLTINPNKRRNALSQQQASLDRARAGFRGETDGPTPARPADAMTQEAAQQLIQTLWATLPPAGSTWSLAKRQAWLQSAEQIFSLVYTRDE